MRSPRPRLLPLVLVALAAPGGAQPAADGCLPPDPCRLLPRPGETAIVFIGDSGYGLGGSSEWGTHAQAEVAARLEGLCPRPDLVFFLGDNVYWRGSPDLFGPRFDTMYQRLLGGAGRVRAALGNHDVKGCRLSERAAAAPPLTCADALVELVREDVRADAAAGVGPGVGPWVDPGVLEDARSVDPRACPPAFDSAYEQSEETGSPCFASAALRHAPFGYGLRGGNPLRYYSVDWPPAPAAGRPRVRVLVADSNTLDVEAEPVETAPVAATRREDRLQTLWMENQLRTAHPEAWTVVAMHHPIYTPRGCAFKLLGRCIGGHGEKPSLRDQLWPAFGLDGPRRGAFAPDLVFAAHNHLYARSRPLDATGHPAGGDGGIRHFVTGGGGAPLYRLQPLHERYAAAGPFHHFVYLRLRGDEAFFWAIDERGDVRDAGCFRRGLGRDGCIGRGTYTSAELVCDPAPLDALTCPAASP
ncbi:MAG TPA: metallophosphoesterase [Vicinamibacteria bacterium]|nr:metallophosphoesterase [Vicinamibacteria bacterium]